MWNDYVKQKDKDKIKYKYPDIIGSYKPKEGFDELGLYTMLRNGVASVHANLISSVVVTPVGHRCNLSCDYCYNSRKTAKDVPMGIMSDEILEKIVQQVNNVAANPEFIWHGGEPLLAGISFYRNVLRVQKKHGILDNSARNSIQTNGIMLDEDWASFFKENDFNVGLSFDSPSEESHTCHKQHPSDINNFNEIKHAISNLKKHNKLYGVLSVINKKNSCRPKELLEFFMQNRVYKFNVNPGLNDMSLAPEIYADYICELFDLWLECGESNIRIKFFEDLIQTFWGLSSNICWLNGNCPNIIRVDLAGDVWPCCDRFIPYDQHRLGNIVNENLIDILQGERYLKFRSVFGQLPTRCVGCEWSHVCKGGCAYNRLINGHGEDGGDHLCGAYKKIFQHVFQKYKTLFN